MHFDTEYLLHTNFVMQMIYIRKTHGKCVSCIELKLKNAGRKALKEINENGEKKRF